MNQPQHPDTLLHQQQARTITRGSRQAADTAAMEAYYDAITAGKSKEETNEIFTNTYKQFLSHGNQEPGTDRKRLSNAR